MRVTFAFAACRETVVSAFSAGDEQLGLERAMRRAGEGSRLDQEVVVIHLLIPSLCNV